MKNEQLPLDLAFLPSYGREDFMLAPCNALAVHYALSSWPDSWAPYPALTIFGPSGCGKSHLAAIWAERSGARVLDPAAFLSNSALTLIESGKNFVLDRLDLLTGEREAEEKLFHLYNTFQRDGRFLLLLSPKSPREIPFVLPDLESRILAAPFVAIDPPDDEVIARVLAKRFHDSGLTVPQNVLGYIVPRIERSWTGIERIVGEIAAAATAGKRPVTIPLAREVLSSQSLPKTSPAPASPASPQTSLPPPF